LDSGRAEERVFEETKRKALLFRWAEYGLGWTAPKEWVAPFCCCIFVYVLFLTSCTAWNFKKKERRI